MPNRKKLIPCPESTLITALWRRYLHERSDADRDELARHYMPWAEQTAAQIARRLGIIDWENAVGDALLTLSTCVIQTYNGIGRFEGFAAECMKRSLISTLRRQRPPMLSLDILVEDPTWTELLAIVPQPTACDCRFQQLVTRVDHRTACLLWLRFQRGLTRGEAAEALGMTNEQAHHLLRKSYAHLRQLPEVATLQEEWGSRTR